MILKSYRRFLEKIMFEQNIGDPFQSYQDDRAPSERGIRWHPSPPLAGVPWGRVVRPVPAEYQLCLPASVAPAAVE